MSTSFLDDNKWIMILAMLTHFDKARGSDAVFDRSFQALPMKIMQLTVVADRVIDDVNRLKEAVDKTAKENSNQTGASKVLYSRTINKDEPMMALTIDLESFHNYVMAVLDIVAKLTPRLLKIHLNDTQRDYFRSQREYLIKNNTLDPEYSKFLDTKMSWVPSFFDDRNKLAHELAGHVTVEPTHSLKYLIGRKTIDEIDNFVKDVMQKLNEFLSFYVLHFSQKI